MQTSNSTLNNRPDDTPTSSPEDRRIETFKIRRGVAGWHLLPANPEQHPLLARLFGHRPVKGVEPQTAEWAELRDPIIWESLLDGLRLIRKVAHDAGLGVRVCGNLQTAPTVQLWRRTQPTAAPPRRVFEGLRGDAAKWGISDFYEEHEIALREVLASKAAFDTSWYTVKKEIQSGRVWRERQGGPVKVEVTASMDDWPSLVDTAVWAAMGKQTGAGDGFSVLTTLGLDEGRAQAWLEDVAEVEAGYSELGADNSCLEQATLSPRISYARLCERLDELMDICEKTLKGAYDGVVESCAQRLVELKLTLGASCRNCKHFQAGLGASRLTPEEPADCTHPRYYALLSANKAFPFEKGCKFWAARYPMKVDG